jgi:serine/threonine-protein kinase
MKPRPALPEPAVATMIGRYLLLYRIAAGAVGYVYAADDPTLGRRVALKVIATDLEDEPETRERFYREARITAQLRHPNIVQVLEVGQDHGRPFIAMELLEGLPLDEHLRARPDLSLEARLDLIIQLCTGLEVAHAEGVVHRDVKPSNIIVQDDGRLKIFDFGLARLHTSTLTANGVVIGSSGYMSPEQAEGRRVDERSDIFSAAAVGYLILSDRPPFGGRNLSMALNAILNEPPAPLATREAPDVLARVLFKALEKSPHMRYQTCGAFLADLRRALTRMVRQ